MLSYMLFKKVGCDSRSDRSLPESQPHPPPVLKLFWWVGQTLFTSKQRPVKSHDLLRCASGSSASPDPPLRWRQRTGQELADPAACCRGQQCAAMCRGHHPPAQQRQRLRPRWTHCPASCCPERAHRGTAQRETCQQHLYLWIVSQTTAQMHKTQSEPLN